MYGYGVYPQIFDHLFLSKEQECWNKKRWSNVHNRDPTGIINEAFYAASRCLSVLAIPICCQTKTRPSSIPIVQKNNEVEDGP